MNSPGVSKSSAEVNELHRLRTLLLGDNYESLFEFKDCLNDAKAFQEMLSGSISEAISLRTKTDETIAKTLAPTVEKSLTESVKNNPAPIADALYPVMGPAIRRSITETMNQTLENFNKALEDSFSLRSMKWRIDALRSGRTYAEIAMLNTLDYQVEQVFLIHRETSILLQHAVVDTVSTKDADMVSSMLSAIQDFVSDSFVVVEGDALNTLRLGDLTVCIETGPNAILAAVVRGSVPEQLRTRMHESLESIHSQQRQILIDFSGDAGDFATTEPVLRNCLMSQAQHNDKSKVKKPWPAILALLVITCLVGYWAAMRYQTQALWSKSVQGLESEPGYVVIETAYDGDLYIVRGLKDPAAREAIAVVGNVAQEKLNIQWQLQPYYSADADFVEKRVISLLNLPRGISYTLTGTTLNLSGTASQAWVDNTKPIALSVAGIDQVNTTEILPTEPTVATAKPAVLEHRLAQLTSQIETTVLYFDHGSVEPNADSMRTMPDLVDSLERLSFLALDHGQQVKVRAIGYSDPTGPASLNQKISQRRADAVVDLLQKNDGISADMQSIGLGRKASYSINTDARARQVKLVVTVSPSD